MAEDADQQRADAEILHASLREQLELSTEQGVQKELEGAAFLNQAIAQAKGGTDAGIDVEGLAGVGAEWCRKHKGNVLEQLEALTKQVRLADPQNAALFDLHAGSAGYAKVTLENIARMARLVDAVQKRPSS